LENARVFSGIFAAEFKELFYPSESVAEFRNPVFVSDLNR